MVSVKFKTVLLQLKRVNNTVNGIDETVTRGSFRTPPLLKGIIMKDRIKRKLYSRGTIPKPTRVTYGQGGYASIKDMEKQCMTKTDYNESLKSKD
jgi:methyl coenzyme M reductase subunit C-like uncharacterized protein (methanogenesis marker protein 7)